MLTALFDPGCEHLSDSRTSEQGVLSGINNTTNEHPIITAWRAHLHLIFTLDLDPNLLAIAVKMAEHPLGVNAEPITYPLHRRSASNGRRAKFIHRCTIGSDICLDYQAPETLQGQYHGGQDQIETRTL